MIDNDSSKWSNNPDLNNQMEQILGSPKGFFDPTDTFKADHAPVISTVDNTSLIREQVYAWIKEDAPLTVKMTVRKEHVDALINRLEKIYK